MIKKEHRSTLVLALLVSTLGAAAVWFGSNGDYVAAIGLGVVALGGLAGYGYGLITMLGSLLGLGVAVACAPGLGMKLEPAISYSLGTTGLTNRMISIGAVGLAVTLVAALVASLLTDRLMQRKGSGWLQWGGFLLGSAQAAVAALLLLGGVMAICPSDPPSVATVSLDRNGGPQASRRSHQRVATRNTRNMNDSDASPALPTPSTRKSKRFSVLAALEEVSHQTRESRLAPIVVQHNPFTQVLASNFNELQETIEALDRDPERVQSILRHPKVMKFRQDERVHRTVKDIEQDETIAQILKAKGPVDQRKIIAILNSPTVLRILDEKELISEAYHLLLEVDPTLGRQAGAILGSITSL